jgi:hypothetical protein
LALIFEPTPKKKKSLKNKDYPLEFDNMKKHSLFVSRFEHVNFVNNGKYSKNNYDNSNYYASFVNFQTYKKCSF